MNTSHASELRFAVLATDTAIFTYHDDRLYVRTIRVQRPPYFPDSRGLPGGLIHPEETAEEASLREIRDRALIDPKKVYVEQLATFSKVKRDPRGRVVAVAYLALVPWDKLSEVEKSSDGDAKWVPAASAKKLAYDHDEILSVAQKRLKSRSTYTTILSKIMPKEFTLSDLEAAYKHILGTDIDRRNFRKKILRLGVVKEIAGKQTSGAFRPAQLYSFVSQKVDEIEIL